MSKCNLHIFVERGDILYDRFRQLIEREGVTPYRVAKDTGIPQSTLSDWKAGRSTPKLKKLVKISNYFRVPVEYFIEDQL